MKVNISVPVEFVEEGLKEGGKKSCSFCEQEYGAKKGEQMILCEVCRVLILNSHIKQKQAEVQDLKKFLKIEAVK